MKYNFLDTELYVAGFSFQHFIYFTLILVPLLVRQFPSSGFLQNFLYFLISSEYYMPHAVFFFVFTLFVVPWDSSICDLVYVINSEKFSAIVYFKYSSSVLTLSSLSGSPRTFTLYLLKLSHSSWIFYHAFSSIIFSLHSLISIDPRSNSMILSLPESCPLISSTKVFFISVQCFWFLAFPLDYSLEFPSPCLDYPSYMWLTFRYIV